MVYCLSGQYKSCQLGAFLMLGLLLLAQLAPKHTLCSICSSHNSASAYMQACSHSGHCTAFAAPCMILLSCHCVSLKSASRQTVTAKNVESLCVKFDTRCTVSKNVTYPQLSASWCHLSSLFKFVIQGNFENFNSRKPRCQQYTAACTYLLLAYQMFLQLRKVLHAVDSP